MHELKLIFTTGKDYFTMKRKSLDLIVIALVNRGRASGMTAECRQPEFPLWLRM